MIRQSLLGEYTIINCQDKQESPRISLEDKTHQSKLDDHGIPAEEMDLHNRPRYKNKIKETYQEKLC